MNSSYFAVPGRGGASAGRPPSPLRDVVAHAVRELLVDGPAAAQAAREQREQAEDDDMMARLMGICEASAIL